MLVLVLLVVGKSNAQKINFNMCVFLYAVPKVIRKVTAMEKEAERCRAELTACLEQSSSDDRRAFEAAEIENAMEMLTLERSAQEVRLTLAQLLSLTYVW